VAGLRYQCVVLRGGQPLFVGRAGPAGSSASAPVLLLVHGLGQNAHRDWADTAADLARDFNVITVDLPGFGASPPAVRAAPFAALGDQLAELLARLAPGRRVHVAGHSLGAALSLDLAHRHADQVDRLVLVDAAGILLKPIFMRHIGAQAAPRTGIAPIDDLVSGVFGRLHDLSSNIFLGRDDRYDFIPLLMRNPDIRQALLGGRAQLDAALSLMEHDFSAAIRETSVPTTLIWGRDDRIAPLRTGRLLRARMQQVRLQIVDGAGHTPMQERPGEFIRLLRAALSGPLPPRRSALDTPAADAAAAAALLTQGDVVCQSREGASYSGHFDSLSLRNCRRVSISAARIGRLDIDSSSVTIDDSVIDSPDVAIAARNSELIATAVQIRGRVAIRADNSWFDLAGVSLVASERGLDLRDAQSRAFFSVSDADTPELHGDVHLLWPRAAGR
jgi:pimeloyl-ACP methyl ester carboxylesterase